MVVDGDVDVNGDGDEGFSRGGKAQQAVAQCLPIGRWVGRVALLVAVAVHVNVAVNDHERSSLSANFSFEDALTP